MARTTSCWGSSVFSRRLGPSLLALCASLSFSSFAQAAESQPEDQTEESTEDSQDPTEDSQGPAEDSQDLTDLPDLVEESTEDPEESTEDSGWVEDSEDSTYGWVEDEEPEPESTIEFVAFQPGAFTAQLYAGLTATLPEAGRSYSAGAEIAYRVGAEIGTLLWVDFEREWQNSLGISAYWDGAGPAGTGGGGSLEHEFLYLAFYLRGGPGISRSRLYSEDYSAYETAAGGNLGLGAALWRLRAGVAYEGRATFGPDPRVTNTVMATVGISTMPAFQDIGIGGGGGFDVGCLFLMCNHHY